MTQTTDSRSENWPAPWGRPADQAPAQASEEEQPVTGEQSESTPTPQPPVGQPVDQPVADPVNQPTEQLPQHSPDAEPNTQPNTQPTEQSSATAQAPVQPDWYPQYAGADTGYDTGYPTPSQPQSGYYPPTNPTYPAQPDTGQGSQGYSGQGYSGQGYSGQGQGGFPPPPAGSSFRTQSPQPRQPRRPGWLGVAGVGIGAAVLSSLLTAGLVNQDNTSTSSSGTSPSSTDSSSSAPQAAGPVTSSSASAPDWSAVAAAVEPSVVAVKVSGQTGSGEGSGIVLDTQGNALTNNHVVAEASGGGSIQVVLADGRGYKATVVGTDTQTDLAVIKIQNPPSGLKPAVLGDSSKVKVGDPVMAVGNPLGLSDTVTTGIVSAVDRPVTTGGEDTSAGGSNGTVFTNAIQTDAAINPGNSGGALLDVQGRLIGINSSIASLGSSQLGSTQSGNIGLGFAIPVNEAKDVANQLLASGKVAHAYLGVSLQDGTVTLNGAQQQTAQVGAVTSGAPAAKAGLKAGDQIVAIDGDRVNGSDSLIAQVRERKPGDAVTLTVVSGGSTKDVKLTMGTRPND
jgi:putative serine protease PepD